VAVVAIALVVAHENGYDANVVVNGVVPVAEQKKAPNGSLSFTLPYGNTVPKFAVFFIHSVTVTTEPIGITPDRPGTPASVSHCPIASVRGAKPFRLPLDKTSGEASGPVVFRR